MLYVSAVTKIFANILISTVLVGFSFFFFFCWVVVAFFFSCFPFTLYSSDWVGHGCNKIISLVFTGFKDRLLTDRGEKACTEYHTGGTEETCCYRHKEGEAHFKKHSILIMSLMVKEVVRFCKLTSEPNQQSFIPLISLSDLSETQLYHKNSDDAHCQRRKQGLGPRVTNILFTHYLVA